MAVVAARGVSALSRALRRGSGTTAPGRVATFLEPRALEKLAGRLTQGVLVVAGTNGKTTTARILAETLVANRRQVVHNRAGANLVGGIVSSLAASASLSGGCQDAIAVLETDEAAIPRVLRAAVPEVVILTNLFRDQLDRFAELDALADRWRQACEQLPTETTVVVNGDDPLLVTLTDGLSARRLLFGIEQTEHRLPALAHSAEVVPCGACGERLTYRQIFVGHLGDWMCESCGRGRPPLHVSANAVELVSPEFQSLKIATEGEVCHFEAHLPGLYNTYNVLAAASAALAVGVPTAQTQRSIAAYRGTFGRGQRLEYRGRMLTLMLVKNPVGGDETLRVIAGANRRSATPMMIVLNDGAADGRDVSWIWDVDFEQVAEWEIEVCCAGTRSADMRNRLYYAGVPAERLHDLGPGLGGALDIFVEPIPSGAAGFILSTYTGLMQLRAAVVRPGQSAASEAD